MTQTTIRMPEALYEKLKKQAKEYGISFNAVMLEALRKMVERTGKSMEGR